MSGDEPYASISGFNGQDTAAFLLHRDNMKLVDRIIAIEPKSVECAFTVPESSLLHWGDRGIPGWAGIEYMAQCVAVLAGARERCEGRPPPIGYLLGSRNYQAEVDFFDSGAEYRVACTELVLDGNGLGAYDCRIADESRTLGQAILTVYRREAETT